MRLALIVALGLAVAGCQSQRPIAELSYSEVKALAGVIEKRCAEQGAPAGSPNWDACTKQEISREDALRRRARQIADSPGPVTCTNFGYTTVCN